MRSSDHLDYVLQTPAAYVMNLLDIGEIHEPTFRVAGVRDIREWATLMRRLTVPYYEEARRHLQRNRSEILADGVNDLAVYTPDFLKRQIEDAGA